MPARVPVRTAQRLQPTRVERRYRGGALLAKLRGEAVEDTLQPEDWVGSDTLAKDGGESGIEGLSRLHDGRLLRDAVADDPIRWLGAMHVQTYGGRTGVLVKLLDAAQRLPIHAHPDHRFAKAVFGTRHGKTEAWAVLDVREGDTGEAWVGFREAVSAEQLLEWVQEQRVEELMAAMNRVELRRGDIVYVPGGVPHAMAGGTLFVELQEPTDYSLHLEWKGYPDRPEHVRHMGIGWAKAVESLVLDAHEPVIGSLAEPERALPDAARHFFSIARQPVADRFNVVVVTGGEGELDGQPATRGDTFVLPAVRDATEVAGDVELLCCTGPAPGSWV